jgi:hypothetical protein
VHRDGTVTGSAASNSSRQKELAMPIVTYISPFDTFRGVVRGEGGLSGQVTYPVGGANYARAFVQPTNPESTLQVLIRAFMTQTAQGFSALSEAQADAWRAAAVGLERKNAAGQYYELSGANLYALINLYRLMDGQALLAAPPALTAPGAIVGITSVKSDTVDLEVTFTHTLTTTDDKVMVRVTQPLTGGARNARTNEYRCITADFTTSIVPATISPMAVSLPMANFSVLPTEYVGVEVLPLGITFYPGIVRRDKNILVGTI